MIRLLRFFSGTGGVVRPAMDPGRHPPAAPSRPRRRRRGTARDFQRSRVYAWEAAHVLPRDAAALPLPECRALVEQAYRWAEGPLSLRPGWRPPAVTDGRGRRHACGSRAAIKLPRWARTRPVVLHECAHGLSPDKHGPRFVKVYVDLLVRFAGMPREGLIRSLRAAGVTVEAEAPARRREAA